MATFRFAILIAALVFCERLSAQEKPFAPAVFDDELRIILTQNAKPEIHPLKHNRKWYVHLRLNGNDYLTPILLFRSENSEFEVRVGEDRSLHVRRITGAILKAQ